MATTTLLVEGQKQEWVDVAAKLQGSTLLVYWYLVANRRRSIGPREVQRALGFRSPSSALFHLDKLIGMQLVFTKGNGRYRVTTVMKVGVLRSFWVVSRFLVPKALIYAVITSASLITSWVLLVPFVIGGLWLAWLPGLFAACIFWIESLVVWRLRPHAQHYDSRQEDD